MVRRAEYQITAKHVHSYAHAPHMWRFIASELTSLSLSLSRAHTHAHSRAHRQTHTFCCRRGFQSESLHMRCALSRDVSHRRQTALVSPPPSPVAAPRKETIHGRTMWSYLNLGASKVISGMADFFFFCNLGTFVIAPRLLIFFFFFNILKRSIAPWRCARYSSTQGHDCT